MYEDINIVIENIKLHFEAKFTETFEINRQHSFVNYKSKNYNFDVQAAFVQARVKADFSVSIQNRINDVLKGYSLEKGAHYQFSSKSVDQPLPIEYCVDLIS
jgi:hypothetical protein